MAARPVNILLIEDNRIAQTTSTLILKHLGYHVTLAVCGKEALKLFKPDFYSLVYVDLGLPDVDGYELIIQLRALDEKSREKTPIVILTAHADRTIEKACFEAGADAVFPKPLLVKSALKIVEKFVYHADVEVEGLKVPPVFHSDLDK